MRLTSTVRGIWGTLTWLAGVGVLGVSVASSEARAQKPQPLEMEGPVTGLSGSCPALTFTVGTQKVMTRATTRIEDGVCTDIIDGRKVEVEGALRPDGTLIADEVDLD